MKQCRGILIPQYKKSKHTKRNPLWGKPDQEEFESIDVSVEIEPICYDCKQIECVDDVEERHRSKLAIQRENEAYFARLNTLKDPYDVPRDEWVKFESYSTYIKHVVWITDGYEVESWSFYKQEPESVEMRTGRMATHWMFTSYSIKQDSVKPLPPKL